MNITTMASSLKAQQIGLEIDTRMMRMSEDMTEGQGDAVLKLMESVKAMELAVNPHLGSNLDVSG